MFFHARFLLFLFLTATLLFSYSVAASEKESALEKDSSPDALSINEKTESKADSFFIPRRKEQFSRIPAYLFLPIPYSIPGVGKGLLGLGLVSNINGSQIDAGALMLGGDAEGRGAGLLDIDILPESLKSDFNEAIVLDIFQFEIDKIGVKWFSVREMEGDKDDYYYVKIQNILFQGGQLVISFFDRRLELIIQRGEGHAELKAVLDSDGNTIVEADDPEPTDFVQTTYGFILDLTDDKLDPRKGFRLGVNRDDSPESNEGEVSYRVMDYNVTGYIPIGVQSSWVFNFFRSDSHVLSQGETDRAKIAQNLGLYCELIADTQKREECIVTRKVVVDNYQAGNTYGTASSLGGSQRLRAYPTIRFRAAHTQMLGTELRFNLAEEYTPFNIGIMSDIRTNIQLSTFYEIGTAADRQEDLWKETRSSYGVGIRIVAGSGIVYRVDVAQGDEGTEFTAIINYPWGIF